MRRPNSTGTITRLSGNRRKPYRVRVTTGWETDADGHTRQIQTTVGTYATYQEAEEALTQYNRTPTLDTGATFAEVYEEWSREKYAHSSPALIQAYRAAYNAVPMLHDVRMKDIKRNHLQNAVDTCGKNYPTLKNVKLLFGFLFTFCIQNDTLTRDYSRYVDIAKHKPKGDAEDIHTDIKPNEIDVLWQHTDDETVKEILMLIYSGLRVGEFLALTPDEVRDGFIIVRNSKTKAGRRRVPLAARTALFWQDRVDVGISYIVPLAVQNDTPDARYATFKRVFIERFAALGLPDHLPHDTRHTTATLLHAAGVDPYVVKRILGHATQDVTEKIYTHISDEMLREAIDKI